MLISFPPGGTSICNTATIANPKTNSRRRWGGFCDTRDSATLPASGQDQRVSRRAENFASFAKWKPTPLFTAQNLRMQQHADRSHRGTGVASIAIQSNMHSTTVRIKRTVPSVPRVTNTQNKSVTLSTLKPKCHWSVLQASTT